MFRYYGFNLWQPELFNRFENYHQSHPNASVTVCELIHDTQTLNRTVPEEPFLLLTNGVTTECKPHIDQRVFINSLTINAVCLFGNVASGYLANRVGRRTMPSNNKDKFLIILQCRSLNHTLESKIARNSFLRFIPFFLTRITFSTIFSSGDDVGGWRRRPRYVLREILAAAPDNRVYILPDGGHGEFRDHQRRGRRLPNARVRRRGVHDGLFGEVRRSGE